MEKQKPQKSMDDMDVYIGGRKIEGIKSIKYTQEEKEKLYKRNFRIASVVLISIIIIQLLYILKQTL